MSSTVNIAAKFRQFKLLIGLVLLLAVAAGSVMIYQLTAPTRTYTDPKRTFSITYPRDWRYVAKGTKAGGGEYAFDEFLPAADYPTNNAYSMAFDTDTTTKTPGDYLRNIYEQKQSTIVSVTNETMNGYSAATIKFQVQGEAYGFQTAVLHQGKIVNFYYSPGMYQANYQAIINSIEFRDERL